jgi:predicted GNAT family N-acyltransferase
MRHLGAVIVRLASDATEVAEAIDLRRRVFSSEQGIRRAADEDGRDHRALHVIAFEDGALVGTCRMIVSGDVAMLGRLAVERDDRRRGVGRAVLAEAERCALDAGAGRIALHSQLPALEFYEKSGYSAYGEVFVEEGIEHVAMEKQLA